MIHSCLVCDRREEGREDGGRRSGYSTKNETPHVNAGNKAMIVTSSNSCLARSSEASSRP